MDSGLGESCESLANVQSPAWSHADFGALRTNVQGALTAIVSYPQHTPAAGHLESHPDQYGTAGGQAGL